MKKLMTSMIIVLPLLILAIMLVSGAIMSLVTHIYVERVEFVDGETLVLVMKDENAPPKETLAVNVLPIRAENRGIVFWTEDESVATVNADGVLTATGFGETRVCVRSAEDAAKTDDRKVIVTDDRVHALKISGGDRDFYVGDELTKDPPRLTVETVPRVPSAQVTWSSSRPEIIDVTQNGGLICRRKGTATITVTSVEDPSITATAELECHTLLVGVTADETDVVTAADEAQFPEIVPYPSDAFYTVKYSSSDEDVATVDAKGKISFRRAGPVTITADARDGRGHGNTLSVKYDCTYGFYMGPLFGQGPYTFDYDAYAGKTEGLGIEFLKDPEGSEREILSVEIDREDLIEYDGSSERFLLKKVSDSTPLGNVKITVHARKYNGKSGQVETFETDICTVTVTRKAAEISFVKPDGGSISEMSITEASFLNFTEELVGGRPASGIGVLVSPANHTDTLSYSMEEGSENAHLDGKTLTFSSDGKATVVVTAAGGAEAKLSVSYTKAGEEDKIIRADGGDVYVSLRFEDAENFQSGILEFTVPDGYRAECTAFGEIVRVDERKIVPLKGGFADIDVTFVPDPSTLPQGSARAATSFTVHVYVDRALSPEALGFDRAEGYTTFREEIGYAVELRVPADAMAGKELFVGGELAPTVQEEDKLVYRTTAAFGGMNDLRLTASVKYAAEVAAYDPGKTGEILPKECTVHTTHGKLLSDPDVTRDGEPFPAGSELLFGDLGEEIVLRIDTTEHSPADFVLTDDLLSTDKISFTVGADTYFTVGCAFETENIATVTLTAVKGTYGRKETTLSVAGRTFALGLDVRTPANALEVMCGEDALAAGKAYSAFLPSLEFTVRLFRTDGEKVSDENNSVHYSFGGGELDADDPKGNNLFTFTVSPADRRTLTVRGGSAEFTCTLEKIALEGLDFEFCIEYTDSGREISVGPFPLDGSRIEAKFPQAMLGNFDLHVFPAGDRSVFLGGFGEEEAEAYFSLGEKEGWNSSFSVSAGGARFSVSVPADLGVFTEEELVLRSGETETTLVLGKANIQGIELGGFDSSSKDDVYKGYQQVHVFAERSDYGDGKGAVDYFRIPFKAESNTAQHTPAELGDVIWQFTRHSDREGGEDTLITRQRGTTVEYGDEIYTVVPAGAGVPSALKKGDDTIAEGGKFTGETRIPWVDVYAEEDKALLYFGGFGGLSEVDVQNDYFGNFGEQEDWEKTEQTVTDDAKEGSGRKFAPSANAYTFLRVEAGDGAKESSAAAHFNFNVLEGDDLVNVFNAAGYYAYNQIVLHENLYGPGELGAAGQEFERATQNGLFLTAVANLGKALIYGNGYQVNLEAKTAAMDKYSESDGITIDRAYNTVIKCANPTNEISNTKQKMVLKMQYAYYCDLSYYYKFNPAGSAFYAKNTAFSFAPKTGIQLHDSNQALYAENIVMVECGTGILVDGAQDVKIYFKGFADILDYVNKSALENLNGLVGMAYASIAANVKDYFEWHGKNISTSVQQGKDVDNLYVNVMTFALSDFSEKALVWKDGGYKKLSEGVTQDNGSKIVNKKLGGLMQWNLFALTYENLDEKGSRLDHATADMGGFLNYTFTGTADMNSLFTEDRYIRLQCEYKKPGEKNFDHILWHKQEVYRDKSVFTDRKSHTENLRESLKGTTWDDGSGVNGDGIPFDPPAAALSALLSQAVIPEKELFAD